MKARWYWASVYVLKRRHTRDLTTPTLCITCTEALLHKYQEGNVSPVAPVDPVGPTSTIVIFISKKHAVRS